jgi:shikimate dehydrogenase
MTDEMVVADVTIDPPDTWLIHEADDRGAMTLDGLETYIDQAAINFKLWTGVDPDPSVLREAVEEFLEL